MIQLETTRTTADFLTLLAKYPEQSVIFHLGEGKFVPEGYHLTELKAVEFNTVDCGGAVNQWNNTVVQLWRSKMSNETGFMTAGKWLSIYHKVAKNTAILPEAEILFEYGDDGTPAIHYQVQDMYSQNGEIHVLLDWIGVRCKALDRRVAEISSACCATDNSKACGC